MPETVLEQEERVPEAAERMVMVFTTAHSRWQYNLGLKKVTRVPRDETSPSPYLGYREGWDTAELESGIKVGEQVFFTNYLGRGPNVEGYLQSGAVLSVELKFV